MQRTKSQEIFRKAKTIIPGGVNSPVRAFKSVDSEPFIVSHGKGAYLFDVDGNKYVDYVCSWGPLVLGHAHAGVVEAINAQAQKGSSYGACVELEYELASLIIKQMPNVEMLRFVSSGTEAAMSAIRLARAFSKRDKIVKFSGCYHGHVDALLVKAGSGVATLGLPDSPGIPKSFSEHTLVAQYNHLASVEELFLKFPGEIACVIIEPIVGNCGFIKPEANFLSQLSALTARHGALLILDEVMTGFRVGLQGAQSLYGIKPDLTLLGKVIGGGMPIAAFGGRKEIMQLLAPLGPVYQAGTLSGNPLALSCGLATLKEWLREGVFEAASGVAKTLVQAFRELASSKGVALIADCQGSMFGFFFHPGPVRNYEESKAADVVRFKKFFHGMLERGVFFAPSQFEAGFVSVAHVGEPLEKTLGELETVFSSVF